MFLSVSHPELLPHLKALDYGLMPIFHCGESRYHLIVKTTKEMILTARVKEEFKIYLLGDEAGLAYHLGLVTAFFDDPDEPLTILSPQFAGDDLLKGIICLLSQTEFDIYFFDELNRELMGVSAQNADAGRFQAEMAAATFVPYDRAGAPAVLQRLIARFSIRTPEDDAKAFRITFGERLYPDNLLFMNLCDDAYQFQGSRQSLAITILEREEPGLFQERDIAVILGRLFDKQCIYLNPVRNDTGKELTDIMIITDTVMIFIQAKDSPNTEAALHRNIDRKRATIRSHIGKACKQLRGALSYAVKTGAVVIRTTCGVVDLPTRNRQLVGLVLVQEMFDDDYAGCSHLVLEVVRSLKLPAILLGYSDLHVMTQHLQTSSAFINGLHDMFDIAMEKNEFPKPVCFDPPPRHPT
jgi:hypothetical protein